MLISSRKNVIFNKVRIKYNDFILLLTFFWGSPNCPATGAVADMPNPPLGADGKPIGPEALLPIFPMALIKKDGP